MNSKVWGGGNDRNAHYIPLIETTLSTAKEPGAYIEIRLGEGQNTSARFAMVHSTYMMVAQNMQRTYKVK